MYNNPNTVTPFQKNWDNIKKTPNEDIHKKSTIIRKKRKNMHTLSTTSTYPQHIRANKHLLHTH